MDTYLEEGYQAWKTRQRVKGGHAKKKRRRLGDDGELRRAGGRVWGVGWRLGLGAGGRLR